MRREKERGDRITGSARTQNMTIHNNKKYDLEINTETFSLEECVKKIINLLNQNQRNSNFTQT